MSQDKNKGLSVKYDQDLDLNVKDNYLTYNNKARKIIETWKGTSDLKAA